MAGKTVRRYNKAKTKRARPLTEKTQLGPKEVSQYGAAILFLIPQVCTFYFFYKVVPPAAEFHHGHGSSSEITFATMYVGAPKIEYVILIMVFLPVFWNFLKCCKCLPGKDLATDRGLETKEVLV